MHSLNRTIYINRTLYQQNILAVALSLPRPASIKETAMIATTIAAIGRNQVDACVLRDRERAAERTNGELIPPSNRLDVGVSGNRGANIFGRFGRRE